MPAAPPAADSKKPAAAPKADAAPGKDAAKPGGKQEAKAGGKAEAKPESKGAGAKAGGKPGDKAGGAEGGAKSPAAESPGQRFDRMAVRAKLAVSEPGDAVEREADAVADKVMRMPEPAAAAPKSKGGGAQPAAPGVQRKEAAGEQPKTSAPSAPKAGGAGGAKSAVQRKEADASDKNQPPAPESTQDIVGRLGPGEALDPDTAAYFEKRLGHELGHVRIHTDAAAALSAAQIQARAFTYGTHIAFASGQYQPNTESGKRLLAHELAHVMQQSEGSISRMLMRTPAAAPSGGGGGDFEVSKSMLEVPPIKGRHVGGYKVLAGASNLKRKGAYDASTRGTKQIGEWTKAVKPDLNKIPADRRPSAASGFDLHLETAGGAKTKVIKAASQDELTRLLQIPTWNAAGEDIQFQVDHMVEYQLGGADAIDNMELLNQAHNGSVGSSFSHGIKKTIRAEIEADPAKPALANYAGPKNAAGLPTAEGVMEAMTIVFKSVQGRARESGRKEGGSMFWSKEQIEALDHVIPQLGGGGNFDGSETSFILLSPSGNLQIAALAHGKSQNKIAIGPGQAGGMAGFKMKQLTLQNGYKDAAAGANIGTLDGTLDFGPAVAIPPGNVSVPVSQNVAGKYAGRLGTPTGEGMPNEVDFKPMSPLKLSDITFGKGVYGKAMLHPSHPALSGVSIPAQIMDGKLGLFYTLDATQLAGKLKIPGLKIDSAGVTLGYDGTEFSVMGGVEFTIQKFGSGYLNASIDTAKNFTLEGGFRADTRLFDEASMKLWYRSKGGFGGSGTLAITKPGKIKGLKSARLTAKYEDSVFTATGDVAPDIPGLKAASLSVKYENDALDITGTLGIDDKVPGVEKADITVNVKQADAGWKVGASGTVTPKLPGLSGAQLAFTYDDGEVLIEGEFEVKKGPLDGKVKAGVTNAEVDETGKRTGKGSGEAFKVYGAADIKAEFIKDKLDGMLKLRLLPDGSVRVGGGLKTKDFEVFPKYPKDGGEFFNKSFSTPPVPLPGLGFSVGSVSVGITFSASITAKAYASIGPGKLTGINLKVEEFDPATVDFNTLEISGGGAFEVYGDAGFGADARINLIFGAAIAELVGSVGVEAKAGLPADKPILNAKSDFTYSQAKGLDISNTFNLNISPELKFRLFGSVAARLNVIVDTITVWEKDWTLAEAAYKLPVGINATGSMGYNSKTGKIRPESPSEAIKVEKPSLEADTMKDVVLGNSAPPKVKSEAEGGGKAPDTQVKPKREEGAAGAPPAAAGGVDEDIVSRLGTGAPLEDAVRGEFEQRFKADLSHVRIYTGPNAAFKAKELNAKAFSVGEHIAFAEGQYQPDTPEGKQLIAHELAHVMQQQGGAARQVARCEPGSAPAAPSPAPAAAATPSTPAPTGAAAPPSAAGGATGSAGRGLIQVPALKLPELKYSSALENNHRKTAYDNALGRTLIRPAGYRRADVDSRQRTLWTGATRAGDLRTQLADKVRGLEPDKVYIAVPRTLTLANAGQHVIVGAPNELALAMRQPRWDRQGRVDPNPFEIDHIVELQVGGPGYDILDNLELLERTANGASGRAIDGYMDEALADYLRSPAAAALPDTDKNAEVLKRQYRVQFQGFAVQGTPAAGKRWTLAEVRAADPAEGLRIYDPSDLTSPAPTDPNAILRPWPAGVDATRFTGSPNTLVLYPSVRGGQPRQVPLRDGQPADPGGVLQGWLPGIDIGELNFTLNDTGDGPIGRIRGRLNHAQLAESARVDVDMTIKRRRGLANAGVLDTEALRSRFEGLLRDGGVTAFSPVIVDEVDVLPGVGLYIAGRVEPTIEMIRNASLDFQVRGNELIVSKTFYGGDIQLGGPLRVDGSDLTVGLGTRTGLNVSGGIAFSIDRLGQGTLRGAGRGREFAVEGNFAFDRGLFDADANISLAYRRGPDAPDGKLSGAGTVTIGEGKVRGVRGATVRAEFDGERRSLDGTAQLDIPGVESATLGVRFTPEDGTTISGSARFRDQPGIRNGQITATLTEADGGWTMSARGGAEATFAGITATLDASYDDGLFKFSAEAPFAAGPATGNVLVGVTNGDVDDDGNVTGAGGGTELKGFGNGTVNVRLTEHLQGGVGLKVRPSGELLVSGRIGIPGSVELFGQYPPPDRARRELFHMPTVSIPLVGFAVGGNTVGLALTINGRITGYAHVGPGLLTQAEIMVEDFNPAQPESLRVTGGATFDLPAAAGVEAGLDAGVSLGAAVVRSTAGINVSAAAGVEAHVTPHVDLDWTQADGLHVHGDLNASLSPQLRFSLIGYAEVVADAFVTSFTLWRKDWNLAERSIGSSLSLGLNVPVDYYSDDRGVVFDPNQVSFTVPELNADTLSSLLEDGGEHVEDNPPA
ncbi:eCIS core domain-containing protein [Pseudoduganella namucuonensis]|uniref:eCIS core domain-containing protein n=1 Tax=Pseudoduganella namucuonensis TaxID=1035707 RepID=A0A1I7M4T0_9BURK|nr:DUF4157 domain-containing protein [Pseudoduganella namucuonensis]SFV16959.1 protein of unknown function [Pseudoduganella namucuonensis]